MTAFLAAISGFAATVAAPFLIQLVKKRGWKARKAKTLALTVSAVIALVWVLVSGVAPSPDGSIGSLEWFGWLLGAATTVYAAATRIYRWFEDRVFKKIPNLAQILGR